MATLRLTNVPKAVVERLERLAAREGISVNAMALRELAEALGRTDDEAMTIDLSESRHRV